MKKKIMAILKYSCMAVLGMGLASTLDSLGKRGLSTGALIIGILFVAWYKDIRKIAGIICIFSIIITGAYSVRRLYPYLENSNVMKNLQAVQTVWWNPSNTYHNDALIYTLMKNKICKIHPDSWYTGYMDAFSKEVTYDEAVISVADYEEYSNLENFKNAGYMVLTIHETLFEEGVPEKILANDVPQLFVNTQNLLDASCAVVFQDEHGNLYIEAESEWEQHVQ